MLGGPPSPSPASPDGTLESVAEGWKHSFVPCALWTSQGDTEGLLGCSELWLCSSDPAPGSSPGGGWGGGWSILPTGFGEWPSAGGCPLAGARVTGLSWGVCRWLCREQEAGWRLARAPPALPVSAVGPSHTFRLSPVLWVSLDCCFLKKQKIIFFTESELFFLFLYHFSDVICTFAPILIQGGGDLWRGPRSAFHRGRGSPARARDGGGAHILAVQLPVFQILHISLVNGDGTLAKRRVSSRCTWGRRSPPGSPWVGLTCPQGWPPG